MVKVKNIIIYDSWMEIMDNLASEQVGALMKGIISWRNGLEPQFNDKILEGMFMVMRNDLDKMSDNYKITVERNRENGKKGGRPKNPENPSGYSETTLNPNNPENLKEKEKERER